MKFFVVKISFIDRYRSRNRLIITIIRIKIAAVVNESKFFKPVVDNILNERFLIIR